jgi:hypothetical protein
MQEGSEFMQFDPGVGLAFEKRLEPCKVREIGETHLSLA